MLPRVLYIGIEPALVDLTAWLAGTTTQISMNGIADVVRQVGESDYVPVLFVFRLRGLLGGSDDTKVRPARPTRERSLGAHASWRDVDQSFQRPTGEVHRSCVRLGERLGSHCAARASALDRPTSCCSRKS